MSSTLTRRLTIARGGLVGGGAALALATLLADRIGLGEPASFGLGQALLALAGAALALVGAALRAEDVQSAGAFARRVMALYRKAALMFFNVAVLLAAVEVGAFAISFVLKRLPAPEPDLTDARATLEVYAADDWSHDYWTEFTQAASRLDYQPFVLWKTGAFAGETINVDAAGIRYTPGAQCVEGAYKVFAFGGSTMWGVGAPDWGTIPAYLQAEIAARHAGPVCVVNFGETAFVSTQEVIRLVAQLQAGDVPDLVIFYDGINDVYAAYQSGVAGVHQNLAGIAARFEQRETDPTPPLVEWLQSTSIYQLLERLAQTAAPPSPATVLVGEENERDLQRLIEPVVAVYLSNYATVGALAEAYGFEYAFFWQPVISVGDKALTEAEQGIILTSMSPALVALYDAVYQEVAAVAPAYEHLYDIAGVFDGLEAPLWIDFVHVTPDGNARITVEMLRRLGMSG
ncbi:MAG: SGNH/GDSL hydrolase family protein [Anaerolineae bacterium]|nr:SGNH/GDSL hydrolase family protein [Anaerolineae bacterium]